MYVGLVDTVGYALTLLQDPLEEDEAIQDAPQEPIVEDRPHDSTSAEPEARPKDKTNYA